MHTFITSEKGATEAARSFLARLIKDQMVDLVMVSATTPHSSIPMPILMADPMAMDSARPFAPVLPFNSARQAVKVLQKNAGKTIAIVLRPCEINALIELSKLNQCVLDHAVIIGVDCPGRMENQDYIANSGNLADQNPQLHHDRDFQNKVCTACKACIRFIPENGDLAFSLMGTDETNGVWIRTMSEKGVHLFEQLGIKDEPAPKERKKAIETLLAYRKQQRASLLSETSAKIKDLSVFEKMIGNCLNCYNCRTACPVCYCKECVFLTDVFVHEPELLIRRAQKKGRVKLPTDSTMFHFTRLAHISHACVGCGQCTSACPSQIPVADFFITVSEKVQALYRYEPGKDMNQPIPSLAFKNNE